MRASSRRCPHAPARHASSGQRRDARQPGLHWRARAFSSPPEAGTVDHIQIAGGPRVVRLSGLVLRCGVAGISADGVVYVGALKFDTPCDLPWPERFKKDNVW